MFRLFANWTIELLLIVNAKFRALPIERYEARLLNVCQQLNLMEKADSWNKTELNLVCSVFTFRRIYELANIYEQWKIDLSDDFLIILIEKSSIMIISWSKRKHNRRPESRTISNIQFQF
jgi:hypothetical protein